MSLESQITALVSAANKLTTEVANKMKGIDQKVDKAESKFKNFIDVDFPKHITSSLERSIYINPIDGNDANDGKSQGEAIRTLSRLTELASPQGFVYKTLNLRFLRGQTYFLESGTATAQETIDVRFFGNYSDDATTELIQSKNSAGVADSVFRCSHFTLIGSDIDGDKAFLRTAIITRSDDESGSFHSGVTSSVGGGSQGHSRAFLKSQDSQGGDFGFIEVSNCTVEINSCPFLSYRTTLSDNTNTRIPTIKLTRYGRVLRNNNLSPLQRLKHHQYFVSSNASYLDFAIDFRASGAVISGFGSAGELFNTEIEKRYLILTSADLSA
ncbi:MULTISPECIES: hypothetical protein [unclassified Halomonas]|uniref:hypothetical protein n=1 Tax=unclassified Halomonas TaxID=2609666 RepID=UPI001CF1ADBE|nr:MULTISPECIES: hypothetical protein [unclassified Halomonas]MCA8865602.1 hypothetical protein [Halomonas sp. SBBP1]UZH10459.1 hypothetical protein OM794_01450 [Halomonas sp. BDJS001]